MRRPSYLQVLSVSVGILALQFWPLYGQPLDFPAFLQEKLRSMQVEVYLPLDSDYRVRPTHPDDFQTCDYAIGSRSEKMEIRYLAMPYQKDDWESQYPHILAARIATHVATNAEDVPMTLLSLGTKELAEFNADWGVVYFFTPKNLVAERRFGELLVLHKEERGTILVFFFFDDPDNPAIDLRFQSARFIFK
ncbi:MAG: hypothetical protein IPL49_11760 [Saprospirales bacterium]|nr:hypothetical protein [Saprospirales bacterium]MBK8491528.1 hypothetical protein [Saprospirales bacterium]